MKNAHLWLPSKYILNQGKLRASRCVDEVAVGSRLITDLVAAQYGSALREHCRGDVLDLGCGKAPLYILYRELAETITCIDWSNSPHDASHADVLCDLNKPFPLLDESFDSVIFSDVLEHLYYPHQAISEITRILRPGGKLLMSVPFMYWLHEEPYDYYRYTRFALERLADECSLDVIYLQELGGAPEVLADLVAKLSARVRVVGSPFAKFVQSTCRSWRNRKDRKRTPSPTARQFSLGYFLVAEARGETRP